MAGEVDTASKGLLGASILLTVGSGLASLGYGIYLLIQYMNIVSDYGNFSLFSISIAFIVVGGLLIITVLLGFIGALKNVSHMRLLTLVLLFAAFVVFATIGVWTMISYKTHALDKSIGDDISNLQNSYENNTVALDRLKYFYEKYNCCSSPQTKSGEPDNSEQVKTFLKNCTQSYTSECIHTLKEKKSSKIYCVAILSLAAACAVFLALIFYAIITQRARAEYAAVPRG